MGSDGTDGKGGDDITRGSRPPPGSGEDMTHASGRPQGSAWHAAASKAQRSWTTKPKQQQQQNKLLGLTMHACTQSLRAAVEKPKRAPRLRPPRGRREAQAGPAAKAAPETTVLPSGAMSSSGKARNEVDTPGEKSVEGLNTKASCRGARDNTACDTRLSLLSDERLSC